MDIFSRFLTLLFVRTPSFIVGVLILFCVMVNFSNVIGRYVFGASLIWAEEVISMSIVWLVFIGSIPVAFRNEHLRMDVFSSRLTGRSRILVNAAAVVTFIVTCTVLAAQSLQVTSMLASFGQTSVVSGIPMAIPHVALFLGFAGMAAAVLLGFRAQLRGSPGIGSKPGPIADAERKGSGPAETHP